MLVLSLCGMQHAMVLISGRARAANRVRRSARGATSRITAAWRASASTGPNTSTCARGTPIRYDAVSEQQQALEQALRRITDDPGELLKEKFRYQYNKRRNELIERGQLATQEPEQEIW